MQIKNLKEITKILQDHELRLFRLEGKKKVSKQKESWYKPGSTVDKLVKLISEGFFNKPKSIKEIISKLKERDFHLKASDLTLPLRKVVKNNLLEKTKQIGNGDVSKKWLYKKI